MTRIIVVTLLIASSFPLAHGWEMKFYSEFFRPGPFGEIVRVDWSGEKPSLLKPRQDGLIHLKAARNAYLSFHLAVFDESGGDFTIAAVSDCNEIEIDIFKEWFHRNKADGLYYPDALIPIRSSEKLRLPDPDMGIKKQRLAAFWIDVWIPENSAIGETTLRIQLKVEAETQETLFSLEICPSIVPREDAIVADHNAYGVDWVSRYFPSRKKTVVAQGERFEGSDPFFSAIHETHRLLYEHRGLFHDLGYGHAGTVNWLFAPVVDGSGENRHITDWQIFDRHFGPLLDGSAFLQSRRGAKPIEFLYLTINPEWPAPYLDFGTDRYEVAFRNVVSEMEEHFREKGWNRTNFEMFFNHKKRYKGFEWDGDETRFPKDNVYFKEYARLLHQAVPENSPVSFVFRHDASWLFRQQMTELAGAVDFWVIGGSTLALYPEAPRILKERGDIAFIYGGSPSHFSSSAEILDMPVDSWIKGIDGFVRWLTTAPGADPWFDSSGASTGMFFSGDRFGLDKALPSVRLKIQRNCLQDIALLWSLESSLGPEELRKKVARMAGGATLDDWWNGEAKMKEEAPWEWSNTTYRENAKRPVREVKDLDGRWWLSVRDYVLRQTQDLSFPDSSSLLRKPTTPRAQAAPYRPSDAGIPNLPKKKFQGSVEDQMIQLARICTQVLDGDRCWKVVTDRAEELLFRSVRGDRWAGMDNYDVDLDLFRSIKKDLIRLSQLTTVPVDCNLWLKVRTKPELVHVVIRQAKDWSQWYRFGQMTIQPATEMQRALAGEQVIAADTGRGLISVLAPIRNREDQVVGFVEICHGEEVAVVTQ